METQNKTKNVTAAQSTNLNEIPRKVLVRDGEVSLPKICDDKNELLTNNLKTKKDCLTKHTFSEPHLCSSSKYHQKIEELKSGVCQHSKSHQTLPKQFSKKVLKKINIPFEEEVYKDLINLKVSEEDIGIPKSFPVKARDIAKAKDPEPVLSDYYKPAFDKEYVVNSVLPVHQIEKTWFYDGHSVSNVMKQWEPSFDELYFF